jgi:3-oxoacyl-[acyl-carrier protein] reductase
MTNKAKVALITGGTRGIGLGIARALVKEGVSLALCGQRAERDVAEVCKELQGAAYFRADIADSDARESLIEGVRQRFGRLDVLVNNAGVAPKVRADLLDASEDDFDRLIGINLRGPYFLTQRVAKWMIEQKSGCIVNISSISETVASPSRGAYCLSKAALGMVTKLFATRLAEHGIPVYNVCPGIIKTDMTAAVKEKYDRLIGEGLTLEPRWGTPEDVGKVVAMLVRGDLPYATGQTLMVDGGLTVQRLE